MEINQNNSSNDPFYNFLSKVSKKIKDSNLRAPNDIIRLPNDEQIDEIILKSKEEKVYEDFLQKFSKIIDNQKHKKIEEIKDYTIKFVEKLKEKIRESQNGN